MRLRTKVRGLSRWGTLCGVLAIMVFATGCPFLQPPQPDCETAADCTDDGLHCTGAPVCSASGTCGFAGDPCEGTALPVCDEETDSCEECTQDSHCDEGEACSDNVCVQTCQDDVDCADDGLFCTGNPVCTEGLCGTSGDPCEGEIEMPICDEESGECVQCVEDGDCAEGETCTDNVCTPDIECEVDADCDDGILCTTDACVDGACVNTPECPQGQSCNLATGNCEDIVCTTAADCDDGLACTDEVCVNGACVFTSVDARCDDGMECTGDATCEPDNDARDANGCVFTGNPCGGATPFCDEGADPLCRGCENNDECDDGIPCTTNTCNLDTGECQTVEDDDFCDDGLFCTGDATCDPGNANADANGCVFAGDPCVCTDGGMDDPCGGGSVAGGYLLCSEDANEGAGGCLDCEANADCNDGIACTSNQCNGVTGVCTNPANDDLCDDGLFCTADDTCDPDNPNADANGCVNETNPCDPMLCEEGENAEVCVACMSNAECAGFDGIACTDDVCDGVTGNCTGVRNDDNCEANEVCDPAGGCVEGDCVNNDDCVDPATCVDNTCQ